MFVTVDIFRDVDLAAHGLGYARHNVERVQEGPGVSEGLDYFSGKPTHEVNHCPQREDYSSTRTTFQDHFQFFWQGKVDVGQV